jgi:hypothetical protein
LGFSSLAITRSHCHAEASDEIEAIVSRDRPEVAASLDR